MIERLSEAMDAALVCNNFSPIPPKFSFHMKKWLVAAWYLQSVKPIWLSNWVSIARVAARFHQASLSRPAATAAD